MMASTQLEQVLAEEVAVAINTLMASEDAEVRLAAVGIAGWFYVDPPPTVSIAKLVQIADRLRRAKGEKRQALALEALLPTTMRQLSKQSHGSRDPLTRRAYALRKYGLTHEAFDALFEAQGRRCGVCLTDQPPARGWCVDHDHETGRVRGVLCSPCNAGIGQLGESAETLRRAADYLDGVLP